MTSVRDEAAGALAWGSRSSSRGEDAGSGRMAGWLLPVRRILLSSELKRGVVAGAALYAGGVAARTLSEVVFAHVMGPSDYGAYSYVFAWMSILALLGGLGVPYILFRFVPEYEVAGDLDAQVRLARFARGAALLGGVTVGAIGGVVIFALHPSGVPLAAVVIGMATVPVLGLFTTQTELARGFRRIVLAYLPFQMLRPLATIALAGIVIVATGGLTAPGGLAAGLLAIGVCLLCQRGRVRELLRTSSPSSDLDRVAARARTRGWLAVAFPLLTINVLAAVSARADVIVVGTLRGSEAAGIYAAAARVALLATFGLDALNTVVAPSLSKLHYSGDADGVRRLVRRAARASFVVSIVAAGLLVLSGTNVLSLFGSGYTAGLVALEILLVGQVVNASTGPVVYLMATTGHHGTAAKVQAVTTALFLVCALPLTSAYGIVGTAIAVTVARSILNIWMALLAQRRLGVRAFVA